MTDPSPGTPVSRNGRRERLVGLLVIGIGAVLLLSTPTWFAGDQAAVGIGQLVVALALAAGGALLVRRSGRG